MKTSTAAIAAQPSPPAERRPGRRPAEPVLTIRLRSHDGRLLDLALPAQRHRRLHLGLLHSSSDGWVELAAGRRLATGKLALTSRRDASTFARGGRGGGVGWLDALLALAERHIADAKEVCVAPAVRHARAGAKDAVSHTSWLWIDVDGTGGLQALRELLRRKPPQIVVESAGSGGRHAYWRLAVPLPAAAGPHDGLGWLTDGGRDAERPIELAHERLIYALGYDWERGRPVPTVADGQCRDRSRVMRLAGTLNGKTGRHARIVWADLALPAWDLEDLVGDLPPAPRPRSGAVRHAVGGPHEDPYKRISPAEYFRRLAGIEVPEHGLVSCPSPTHADRTPSCHVGTTPDEGWWCFGCDGGGAIYDLASLLLGGPTGRWLRAGHFARARERVREAFGEL